MLNSKKKYNHYVPQMYLRGFFDPLEEAKKQNVLWLHEVGKRPKRVTIRNVGGEEDFYAYEDAGKTYGEIEDKLAEMEHSVAPTLKKLRSGIIALSAEEREEFATFVALTLARVRFFSDLTNKFAVETRRQFADACLRDRRIFEKYVGKPERSSNAKLPTSFEEMREYLEKVSSGEILVEQTSRGWTLKIMMESALDLSPLLEGMSWGLLQAARHEIFVTTDNPVVVVDPYKSRSKVGGVSYSKAAFFTFPISRDYCLQGVNSPAADGTQLLRPSEVHEINKTLIAAAYRYVFSPTRASFVQKIFEEIHAQKGPLLPSLPQGFLEF
jgi:hypothetical protein